MTNSSPNKSTAARKPRAKHGNGLDTAHVQSVEDMQQARYRKFVTSHEYTKKDIVLTVLATTLVMLVAHTFTNALYGF